MTGVEVHAAFAHSALLHEGPHQLAEVLGPEIEAGVASGDAFLVCLDAPATDALRAVLPPDDGVTYIPLDRRYSRPGVAMASLHEFVTGALDSGAPTAWSIGAIPFQGNHLDRRWSRYELAVDAVLGHLPVRAVCSYDLEVLSADTITEAHCTHETVASRHGTQCGTSAPRRGAVLRPDRAPDLASDTTSARELRRQLAAAFAVDVPGTRLTDLQLAATELITNATTHGAAPVGVEAWLTDDGVVMEVSDHGDGVLDRYAELRQLNRGAIGGYGLWMVGQLADEVEIDRRDGRTVVSARFA